MPTHTLPDPDRHDTDVLFSRPEIYVARPCGDDDIIDADEAGMYVLPARSIEPARRGPQQRTRTEFQPPAPNLVDSQPWYRSPEQYENFVASGHNVSPGHNTPDSFDRGPSKPDLPDHDPQAVWRKTHLMIGLFEDRFGLYLFLSHTARRYLYLAIGLIILLFMGKLSEAAEFVLHFIF